MTNVTSEHEAGDVLHASALEVAEELERTQKDQGPSTGRSGLLV